MTARRDRHAGPMPPLATGTRIVAVLVVLLGALTLLSGCARVRAALAVQPDDTVRGEIVVATPARGPDDPGPQVTIPPGLGSVDIDVEQYREQDYVGSRLSFSGLSFAEVSMLTSVVDTDGRVQLALRRVGDRIVTEGVADLATVSADRADFQLKVTFPGEVLGTNGDTDAGTVTWVFEPGEQGRINAVVAHEDPDGPSTLLWTLLVVGLVAAVTVLVVGLARHDRNPSAGRLHR